MDAGHPTPESPRPIPERLIVFLVGAIQFTNILDFMMVMPLGPDFAVALGIPTSKIGLLGGSYTLAAACTGILGSLFLDRFDRRRALAVAMLGLVIGTAAGGFATNLTTLMLARVVAGCFGGPATSLSLAVIADTVAPARRGKAMGAVMGAFSAASVLGVPAGLELARRGGGRMPFFAVAATGLVVATLALVFMPPMRAHLARAKAQASAPKIKLFDSLTTLALVGTALVTAGRFAIIPNISAFLQHNLGYPREHLGLLYMAGGVASFGAMRGAGYLADRFGMTPLVLFGTGLYAITVTVGFVHPITALPVVVLFMGFMLSGSVQMVPLNALSSRVPRPAQRARFMSAQSAVQHTASATGALTASMLLTAEPSGRLIGMDRVALGAIVLALLVPIVTRAIETRVRAREALGSRQGSAPAIG